MDELREWILNEYERRTQAVAMGTAPIDWIDPGTRVGFSEVCSKAEELGIRMNVVALRLWVHEVCEW